MKKREFIIEIEYDGDVDLTPTHISDAIDAIDILSDVDLICLGVTRTKNIND